MGPIFHKLASQLGLRRTSFQTDRASPTFDGDHGSAMPYHKATYLVPGSMTVAVSGESRPRTVSQLKGGEKILGMSLAQLGDEFQPLVWVTVNGAMPSEESMTHPVISVYIDGEDRPLLFAAEQRVLAKNRNNSIVQQRVNGIRLGSASLIVYSSNDIWHKISGSKVSGDSSRTVSSVQSHRGDDVAIAANLYKMEITCSVKTALLLQQVHSDLYFTILPSTSSCDVQAASSNLGRNRAEANQQSQHGTPRTIGRQLL